MEELLRQIVNAECEEYGRASVKFGAVNNSDHESFAVLREEADEAADVMEEADSFIGVFWAMVKCNEADEHKVEILKTIQRKAELAAAESIQVAAMARKAIATIERRNSKQS